MSASDQCRKESPGAGSGTLEPVRERHSVRQDRLEVNDVRQLLKNLPVRTPSVDLKLRLRVAASREASHRRTVPQGLLPAMGYHLNQCISMLMRPMAIPTAGGFLSALLLFGVLSPSLFVRGTVRTSTDIPTGLYLEPSVKSSLPLEYDGEAMLVEVALDQQGRLIEYSVSPGTRATPEVMRSIENHLLTMVFNPAVVFGQPTASKMKIWLLNNRIDIRG